MPATPIAPLRLALFVLAFVGPAFFAAAPAHASAQSVTAGQSVSLSVSAAGTAPFSYQWFKNGTPIPGATEIVYALSNVQAADTGCYDVVVSNAVGSTISDEATLTVNPATIAPVFTAQPESRTVTAGGAFTLTAAASGSPAPSFQWRKNGADIGGATGASYTVASAALTDAGTYTVVATNSAGSVSSSGAALTVTVAPALPGVSSDLNGDGQADLVWQNASTGEREVWLMHGTRLGSEVSLGTVPTAWQIRGAADLNGDGQADILWQNVVTGERKVWLMNGTTAESEVSWGTIPVDWEMVGAGDFNGDGHTDILWQRTTTGERGIWLMNGTTVTGWVSLGIIPTDWEIAGTGDFNGDGHIDILWQRTTTGERGLWLMDGTTVTGWVSFGVVPTDWQMRN